MFGFDERFTMFDITPVENQFVLEYLPGARGDYVKVYLYGLMRCYHPEEDMSLSRMSRDLGMSEEDVTAAFRYWERRCIVRRISDNPPKWQYVNIKQITLTGGEKPEDPEYEAFSSAVYDAFDKVRRLHGNELNTCFEWKEDLKLPTEVILMLLNHMVELRGRNFRIADAGKTAVRMAEENIRTVEAADEFFARDEKVYAGTREVLRKLGKSYAPSEAQVRMYLKWIRDWHFTHEAVLEAVKLTAKGDPSMGYLDGILDSLRKETESETALEPEQIKRSTKRADGLRAVLRTLGRGEVNQQNLALYDQMTAYYPQEIILTAARECGHSGKGVEETLKLLQSWKEKGLETGEEVDAYVQAFHDQTELIRELRRIWGTDERKAGSADRSLVSRWQNELGYDRSMILAAAPIAAEAGRPMAYLDKILRDCRAIGIDTPEAMKKACEKSRPAGEKKSGVRPVSAQQYEQRDYQNVPAEIADEVSREMDAFRRRNGGETDA